MRYWDVVERAAKIMEGVEEDAVERLEQIHGLMSDVLKQLHEADKLLARSSGKLKFDLGLGDVMEPVSMAQDKLATFTNKIKLRRGV